MSNKVFVVMKLEKTFTSVFRLIGVYEDETAFVLPLQTASPTDARMLSVSTREQLDFVGAANIDVVRQSPAFSTVERRCSELVRAYMNSIHVLVAAPDMDALARGNQLLRDTQNLRYDETLTKHQSHANDEVGSIYDEIDDIYRYVRHGGEPPGPRSQLNADVSADMSRQQPTTGTQSRRQHNAADYNWEEPIYEDIEKIRQRKRQRATTTETTTKSATTTTTTISGQEKQSNVDVMPIGNLRQLIKRFSMLESTTSLKQSSKPATVDRTPPVPPKLTVNVDVTSPSPDSQTEADHRQQEDLMASQTVVAECVDDSVNNDVQPHPQHVVDTSPAVCRTSADDCHSSAGCVTSVLVSRDTIHRRHDATSPYYCSRVSVGGSSSLRVRSPVNTETTVTRISTLSRKSARRQDLHHSTA